jgi:hypothetical protein
VDNKTFVLKSGIWTDTSWNGNGEMVKIPFNSDDYYKLLGDKPEWGKYFSVGDKVLVVLEGKVYQVVEAAASPSSTQPTISSTTSVPQTIGSTVTVTPPATVVGGPVTIDTGTPSANFNSNSPATTSKASDSTSANFGLIALIGLILIAGIGAGVFVFKHRRP